MKMSNSDMYNEDFYLWIQKQLELFKSGNLDQLDIPNLTEEIESMGKKEISQLHEFFSMLIENLLVWEYHLDRRTSNCVYLIKTTRRNIERALKTSPSLRFELDEIVKESYDLVYNVRFNVIEKQKMPNTCPYYIDELLDNDFYPGLLTVYNKQILEQYGIVAKKQVLNTLTDKQTNESISLPLPSEITTENIQ